MAERPTPVRLIEQHLHTALDAAGAPLAPVSGPEGSEAELELDGAEGPAHEQEEVDLHE